MDDEIAARLANIELKINWLYRAAGHPAPYPVEEADQPAARQPAFPVHAAFVAEPGPSLPSVFSSTDEVARQSIFSVQPTFSGDPAFAGQFASLEQSASFEQSAGHGAPTVAVSPGPSPTVKALVRAGKKIEAIKVFRSQTGVGLKQAKDVIDGLR